MFTPTIFAPAETAEAISSSLCVSTSAARPSRSQISKYRAVVAAVENALQNYGNNPNKSITVGDLSITYKDYADLLSILAYWRRRAEEDETGQQPKANGPKFMKVRFV